MRLFVDAGAWFALRCRSDQDHVRAGDFFRGLEAEPFLLYTTDYVVDEAVTLIRERVSHRDAVAFLDMIGRTPQITRRHVEPGLLDKAEAILRRYSDKRWSYTDCVSFAYMDEIGLDDAFTFDRNFAQYGKRVHPA